MKVLEKINSLTQDLGYALTALEDLDSEGKWNKAASARLRKALGVIKKEAPGLRAALVKIDKEK